MAYKVKGGCVDIEFLVLGMVQTNTYIISNGTSTFVVDPSCDADKIFEAVGNRQIDTILLTHRHSDHVGALKEMHDRTGATVVASTIDAPWITGDEVAPDDMAFDPCPVDKTLNDGDVFQVGEMKWKVISTPGHTPGGISLFLDPQYGNHPEAAPVLIAGDTLFCGSIGRTDFSGGSMRDMRNSLRRLSQLPDDTIVLPGHNDITKIGYERKRVFAFYA